MRRGQLDHHVQAYVRDRVRVLEMLEELHRLRMLREKREAKHVEVCELTQLKRAEDGTWYKDRTYTIISQ